MLPPPPLPPSKHKKKVYIDGSPCLDVTHTPGSEETEITCVSPPITADTAVAVDAAAAMTTASDNNSSTGGYYEEWTSTIEVVNGRLPGLKHGVPYLSYQVKTGGTGKGA